MFFFTRKTTETALIIWLWFEPCQPQVNTSSQHKTSFLRYLGVRLASFLKSTL